jgi:hypothetical protein
MTRRHAAVAMRALTRTSSVRSTSRVNAWSNSADAADRCFSSWLCHNVGIVAPDAHSASIQRAAEACRWDRHSQQHQAEQRNCLVLQILQRRAFQRDGADDARSIF